MASRPKLSVPTGGALPHSLRLSPNHRDVIRAIHKLSRQSLITLALHWLNKKHRDFCRPYLAADDDESDGDGRDDTEEAHRAMRSYDDIVAAYRDLDARRGSKKDVVERILECDWRHGISLYQLAMAETHHLLVHQASLRWNAKRLARVESTKGRARDVAITETSDHLPRLNPQTFLVSLICDVSPVVKAHYYLTRLKELPIVLLRVYIHDSPYATEASLRDTSASSPDGSRSVFVLFPECSPFVYVSLATNLGQTVGPAVRNLRDVVLQAVPKALSRPACRWELQNTNFSARPISTLLSHRGPGRTNAANGGWTLFATKSFSQNALDLAVSGGTKDEPPKAAEKQKSASGFGTRPLKRSNPDADAPDAKRRKLVTAGRFGPSAEEGDGRGMDRFEVRIDDSFPALSPTEDPSPPPGAAVVDDQNWTPNVSVAFHGPHVFAGARQLAEEGVVDGAAMPAWMTGEAAVSVGVVKDGRVESNKNAS